MRSDSEMSHLSQNWLNRSTPAAYDDLDDGARAPLIANFADSMRGAGRVLARCLSWAIP